MREGAGWSGQERWEAEGAGRRGAVEGAAMGPCTGNEEPAWETRYVPLVHSRTRRYLVTCLDVSGREQRRKAGPLSVGVYARLLWY